MRAVLVAISIALMTLPAGVVAEGPPSGRGGGGGSAQPALPRGPSVQAPGQERLEQERARRQEVERKRVEREQRAEVQSQIRERPGETPETSAAPPETGGFLGRLRRFFGFERSQERMSEQGRAHERATEQDRGPSPDDGEPDE